MPRPTTGSGNLSRLPLVALALFVLIAVAFAGCQVVGRPAFLPAPETALRAAPAAVLTPTPQASQQARAAAPSQAYTAKLEVAPSKAEVGSVVEVRGSGYPAGGAVDLVWYTATGRYEVEGGTEFVGQRYSERSEVLATVRADQSGNIATTLTVPVGFGGPHDLRGRVDGKEISQTSVLAQPRVTITPQEGPVGTPIELRMEGIDYRTNINNWNVLWDNKYLGLLSAVTTNGVAVARFRAAGPVGEHYILVGDNAYGSIPYLNWDTGPFKDQYPIARDYTFRVTSDPGPGPAIVEDFSAKDNPWPQNTQGPAKLSLSVDRGPVGTKTTLRGSELPPNSSLSLRWWTTVGNRVSGKGYVDSPVDLGVVQTGADGTFVREMAIPDDLGGQHRIDVVSGDKVLGSVGMVIEPSLVSITPTRLRAGDRVTIHLKGVGWTTYDNTYTVTYDNSYIGYVCGFSTNGDVPFSFTVTGGPGTHIIDLYPTIYKGKDTLPWVYSAPQLTYADDHPQRITPAIRLAIEIVP